MWGKSNNRAVYNSTVYKMQLNCSVVIKIQLLRQISRRLHFEEIMQTAALTLILQRQLGEKKDFLYDAQWSHEMLISNIHNCAARQQSSDNNNKEHALYNFFY